MKVEKLRRRQRGKKPELEQELEKNVEKNVEKVWREHQLPSSQDQECEQQSSLIQPGRRGGAAGGGPQ